MDAASHSTERRFADRRRRGSGTAAETWFAEPGAAGRDAAADVSAATAFDASHGPSPDAPPGSSPGAGGEPGDAARWGVERAGADGTAQTAFERIYRAFLAARAALGLMLLLGLIATGVAGLHPGEPVTLLIVTYGIVTVSMWLLPRALSAAVPQSLARLRSPQWLATIGVDLMCFTTLHVLALGSSVNYAALLVLPVLMAGVLTPRILALATAAAVTLALLGTAWHAVANGAEAASLLTQAALSGAGFFVITVVAGELAGRLAREEIMARGSLQRAQQQEQLNRLVLDEMHDGVLVVDRLGSVRAANPAALRLLTPHGTGRPAPFALTGVAAWDALVQLVEQAFGDASWPEAGRDVLLGFESGAQRGVRARIRFTRRFEPSAPPSRPGGSAQSEELCVLFLEDVRHMQARSRQEKLAAMGRVSAGIAHEIRNPLAAISQANALLAEDATDPGQRQLTCMVAANVERLKRIVDDVMEVAPGHPQDRGVIDATAQVRAICSEWARANGVRLGAAGVLCVDVPAEPLGVDFDAEHLRRVIVNLLDNASRHATRAPGAIHVRLDSRHEAQAFLSIASDGAPISADVEPYLFEPFFSTRSRGTGLGLYICRELCERYGASIDYRLRAAGESQRNEFYVDMRRRALEGAAALQAAAGSLAFAAAVSAQGRREAPEWRL